MLLANEGRRQMPWQEQTTMSQKQEFVMLAQSGAVPLRALCRRFGISPTTGYKWLGRYADTGATGLLERSCRPHRSPARTPPEVEQLVLRVRAQYPAWGGRKLARRLRDLGHPSIPSPSTITAILARHGQLDPEETATHHAWRRFERPEPNALWQLDFKGPLPLAHGQCHPLSVLDDHSRFALGLIACADQQSETVQAQLTRLFQRYGLPQAILTDNGPPWGVPHATERLTRLGAWLVRLGVRPLHGRPHHPQTQGKVERFHRTLAAEHLQFARADELAGWQAGFDAWRDRYNLERPHAALKLATPASRYEVSPRRWPTTLPPIVYGPDDAVRAVHGGGQISYRGRAYYVSSALVGERVALRPTATDGVLAVVYCQLTITHLDLRQPSQVGA